MIWDVEKLIRGYSKGVWTRLEVFNALLEVLGKGDFANKWACVPADFRQEIIDHVEACPRDEAGWEKLRTFHIGSSLKLRKQTREEEIAEETKRKTSVRQVVESIRAGLLECGYDLPFIDR